MDIKEFLSDKNNQIFIIALLIIIGWLWTGAPDMDKIILMVMAYWFGSYQSSKDKGAEK